MTTTTIDTHARETWTATLGQLEMQLPRATFDAWLKQTQGIGFHQQNLLVEVPSVFTIAWLEQRMYQTILRTLRQVSGQPYDVRFQVSPELSEPPAPATTRLEDDAPHTTANGLSLIHI